MITFESDCKLLDKFIIINAGLSGNNELIKNAGIISSLEGIGQSIVSDIKAGFQERGWKFILDYLTPAIFKRFFGFTGMIVGFVLEATGIHVDDYIIKAFDWAKDQVKSLISSKGEITKEDVDSMTNGLSASSSLSVLYEIEKQGHIVNILKNNSMEKTAGVFDFIPKIISWLIGEGKYKTIPELIKGLIKWFIKAVLLGVAGISGAKYLVNKTTEPSTEQSATPKEQIVNPIPAAQSHSLNASGQGMQHHENAYNTAWVVKLINNSIPDTLIAWALRIYPQLAGHENEIRQSSSFNNMVSILDNNYNTNTPAYLEIIPNSGLHTWKDIVDRFVGETARNIKE